MSTTRRRFQTPTAKSRGLQHLRIQSYRSRQASAQKKLLSEKNMIGFAAYWFEYISQNKRSFGCPGDVARGVDLRNGQKSVRGNWPLWSPVVSRGLQGPPVDDRTDNRHSSQSFKYDIETKTLMSKCFDHKTMFSDTHRHFRPAIEISRKRPIVCGGLELKKSN